MKRRVFSKSLAASGLLAASAPLSSCFNESQSLNILVLGGTSFVGPAIVNAAINNNHKITLFNRGITNPGLFPNLKLIKGDRDEGIGAYAPLKKENWDIIIDVWPEKSKLVDEATTALSQHTKHYIYISSIAVYNDFHEVGLKETSETVNLDLRKEEWSYPEEKYAGEKFVIKRFPDNHSIIRCSAITGWRDPALNLAYWCIKLKRDDEIIAPGSGLDPIQFIDVKDVGRFTIKCASEALKGIYNCVGPTAKPLLWKEFLTEAKGHFNSKTKLIWADEAFLGANNVVSFTDLPLWAPLSEEKGFMQISNIKLQATQFTFSPISKTLKDCMAWLEKENLANIGFGTPTTGLGLSREKELKLIASLNG